jgi:PAS domain S-box-containing protein
MLYQRELEILIRQLQTELHQMHDKFMQEKSKLNKLEVKYKAYKEKLIQEKKLLRKIIDSSSNLIFVHDSDNRFVLANQATAQIYNTSIDKIVGQKSDIFKVDEFYIENLSQLEKELVLITQEYLILPTKETRYFQVTRFIIAFENHRNYILCVCIDMTKEKLLEEKNDSCNKDQIRLREMISNFINITSHEFRTPLTTILSSSELLESYGKDLTEEKALFHLNRIQSSVQHMVLMLDNLLFLEDNI